MLSACFTLAFLTIVNGLRVNAAYRRQHVALIWQFTSVSENAVFNKTFIIMTTSLSSFIIHTCMYKTHNKLLHYIYKTHNKLLHYIYKTHKILTTMVVVCSTKNKTTYLPLRRQNIKALA